MPRAVADAMFLFGSNAVVGRLNEQMLVLEEWTFSELIAHQNDIILSQSPCYQYSS